MQWEQLTSTDFAKAVRETGVCIMTFGVIEKHSEHLPLGTDFLNGHRLACQAAEKEPAVVFPPFYFGQIYEARCFPGTLTIKPTLLIELITAVLDEIGRNGFKKIILLNAHGGNEYLLPFLCQTTLWEQKPYTLYLYQNSLTAEEQKAWEAVTDTAFDFHAGETETAISLAGHPELVHMDRVPDAPTNPLGRMNHLPGNFSGIAWYADFPDHYAGDARTASAEKGEKLRAIEVNALARFIQAVKADTAAPALEKAFFEREAKLRE